MPAAGLSTRCYESCVDRERNGVGDLSRASSVRLPEGTRRALAEHVIEMQDRTGRRVSMGDAVADLLDHFSRLTIAPEVSRQTTALDSEADNVGAVPISEDHAVSQRVTSSDIAAGRIRFRGGRSICFLPSDRRFVSTCGASRSSASGIQDSVPTRNARACCTSAVNAFLDLSSRSRGSRFRQRFSLIRPWIPCRRGGPAQSSLQPAREST